MPDNKNKIIVNFLRIGAYLLREGNRIAEKYGINQQQFVVLNFIGENELVSQKEICSSLLYEKSNVSKIIKRLEKIGLVEKKSSSGDLRYSHINITPKGQKVINQGIEDFNEFNTKLLGKLSDNEIEMSLKTTTMLNKLIKDK
jgi:DNA-binding MarR family transcriptional regulator